MAEQVVAPAHKRLMKRVLTRASLDVRRRNRVPFGVRWQDDLRYYLNGRDMQVAFDVGAHAGETALVLLQEFPGLHVHSFEALPENYDDLTRATAGLSVSSVHAAVSDHSGTATLSRGPTTFRASLHGDGPTVEVPAVTIDDYMRDYRVERVDLLKVDTEGHEAAVLAGASNALRGGAIEFVVCECDFTHRPDEPHGDFREIFERLEPLGYRVVSFYTSGVDNLGWLWGDVLFRLARADRSIDWQSRSPFDRQTNKA